MAEEPEINLPEIVAEVTAAFMRYEEALNANDVAVLERAVPRRALYAALRPRRGALRPRRRSPPFAAPGFRPAGGSSRNTVITTFGRDFATASTEFRRPGQARHGRQQQSWVRFPEGWRIVAAHVSFSAAGDGK